MTYMSHTMHICPLTRVYTPRYNTEHLMDQCISDLLDQPGITSERLKGDGSCPWIDIECNATCATSACLVADAS
jgi:hypothetical protein